MTGAGDAPFAQAAAVAVSTAILALLLWASGLAAARFDLAPEVSRKLVHVAVGCYALSFPLLFGDPVTVALIALGAILLLLAARAASGRADRLGAALHGVSRQSYGDLLFAVSIAFLFFRSGATPVLYVLPVAVLTLADAAAALAGSGYGRRWLQREEGRKSVEGAAVFFLVTWLVGMIALLLLSDAGRGLVIALSLSIAVVATLIEADSWHGFDNLFVPVAVHLLLVRLLPTSVSVSLLVAAAVIAVWVAAHRCAGRVGMSPQAACATVLTIAVLLVAMSVHNVVLPVLAILAHRMATTASPPPDQLPDFDFITAVALVALGWLVLGTSMNASAINYFLATMASLAVLHLALAARRMPRRTAAMLAALLAAGLVAMTLNAPVAAAGPPFWIAALGSVLAAGVVGTMGRALLLRGRAAKAAVLASALPVTVYLLQVTR